ncbi:MAG: hypothetical protein ACPGLV_12075 [Bacteroidia bacterium]
MIKWLSIAALAFSLATNCLAQLPKVEVIETKEKVFNGTIGEYPVTIYLCFHKYSNYSLATYSLKGWYYYNKFKKQIPLVGIYNNGNLTLYNFNDTSATNNLLEFRSNFNNFIDEGKHYTNLEGFDEKFEISADNGIWRKKDKTLKVLINEKEKNIIKAEYFLRLDSNRLIDLKNYGIYDFYEQKFISSNSKGIVLEYTCMSNPNVMGRCGAGEEKYLLFIQFNSDGLVADFGQYLISSCNMSIEIDSVADLENEILQYKCINYMNETEFILNVDKTNSKVYKP